MTQPTSVWCMITLSDLDPLYVLFVWGKWFTSNEVHQLFTKVFLQWTSASKLLKKHLKNSTFWVSFEILVFPSVIFRFCTILGVKETWLPTPVLVSNKGIYRILANINFGIGFNSLWTEIFPFSDDVVDHLLPWRTPICELFSLACTEYVLALCFYYENNLEDMIEHQRPTNSLIIQRQMSNSFFWWNHWFWKVRAEKGVVDSKLQNSPAYIGKTVRFDRESCCIWLTVPSGSQYRQVSEWLSPCTNVFPFHFCDKLQ